MQIDARKKTSRIQHADIMMPTFVNCGIGQENCEVKYFVIVVVARRKRTKRNFDETQQSGK